MNDTEINTSPLTIDLSLNDLRQMLHIDALENIDLNKRIHGLASLQHALPHHLSFCDNPKYIHQLTSSLAGACLVTQKIAALCPAHITPIIVSKPQVSFIYIARQLYAHNLTHVPIFHHENDIHETAQIHDDAELEHGVTIDPNVVIGCGAIIGSGTKILAGTVIGENVTIGRDCSIGAHISIQNAHIGNKVIIHSGARIGQDGFGFHFEGGKHVKIPQIARVIIQDNVEIGANTAIDRGSLRDTVIGDGTKIDNLVQIAHNVVIGRDCIIVAFVALAGSCTLEDNVILAGNVSVNNHVTIGRGAMIFATSAVKDDVPRGGKYGGQPAKPMREWFREIAAVERLGRDSREVKS